MTTSIFNVTNWEEVFTIEKKIAHAVATYSITGDLEGEMSVDYSIFYLDYNEVDSHQSSSSFKGFNIFTGKIGNQSGLFALIDQGSFIKNEYEATVEIIEGTGTGDFKAISGKGTYHPTSEGMELLLTIETE